MNMLGFLTLGYLALIGAGLFLALKVPKGWVAKGVWSVAVLGVLGYPVWTEAWAQKKTRDRIDAARALFDEKCRTVAGEKIYRRVEGVEGVLLLKVRPVRTDRMLQDPNWEGAAFAHEAGGGPEGYIKSFLGYEHPASVGAKPLPPTVRGHINTNYLAGSRPGYRWVDVIDEKDGKRYRYSGSEKVVGRKDTNAPNVKANMARDPNYDLNVYRYTLDRVPAPDPAPRYAVTYEDHVIPEERALWVASTTVRALDMLTGQTLGEVTHYAQAVGPATSVNPSPWLSAHGCPKSSISPYSFTRQFVDQVLLPIQE